MESKGPSRKSKAELKKNFQKKKQGSPHRWCNNSQDSWGWWWWWYLRLASFSPVMWWSQRCIHPGVSLLYVAIKAPLRPTQRLQTDYRGLTFLQPNSSGAFRYLNNCFLLSRVQERLRKCQYNLSVCHYRVKLSKFITGVCLQNPI